MTIDLIVVGKTDLQEVNALTEMYFRRINRYLKFSIITVPDIRNSGSLDENSQKSKEGEMILKQLGAGDYAVLLDDKGNSYTSVDFAGWVGKRMGSGIKRLVFIVGGPYGFSPQVYERANEKLSLSKMTFSHQIIRAIFTEQLYRAFTILNNEPYHHR